MFKFINKLNPFALTPTQKETLAQVQDAIKEGKYKITLNDHETWHGFTLKIELKKAEILFAGCTLFGRNNLHMEASSNSKNLPPSMVSIMNSIDLNSTVWELINHLIKKEKARNKSEMSRILDLSRPEIKNKLKGL